MEKKNCAVEAFGFNMVEPWEACVVGERDIPSPGPDQVVVHVLCRPVNPADILSIRGFYQGWRPKSFPAVPGLEGMGVIHQIGVNVTNVTVGQRVIPWSFDADKTGQGLWQEYIVIPAQSLFRVPDTVSDEAAAQFFGNPWTVVGMFRALGVPKGEYVVQTAAASVLGRMFIQYCHDQGVKTINLVRRREQAQELEALGADVVIDVSEVVDVAGEVRELTRGKMAYAGLDCVGGHATKAIVESIRNDGTIISYGGLSSRHIEAPIADLCFRNIHISGFWLPAWMRTMSTDEFIAFGTHIMMLLEKQILTPLVGQKFPLHEVKEAINKTLEPNHGGKVLMISY